MLPHYFKNLINCGLDKTVDALDKQRTILTNSLTLATIGFILLLIGLVVFYGLYNQLPLAIASILMLCSVFWLNAKGRFTWASLLLVNYTSGAIICSSYLSYQTNVFADTENWLIGFIAVSVFLFDKKTLTIQFIVIFLEFIFTKYLKSIMMELPIDRDFAILVTNTVVMCLGIYMSMIIVKKALTKSHESLRKSNETKKKLLSIIAHDIKSPLSTFEALLSASQSGLISQEDFLKHQKTLLDNFGPLNDTINSVLGWSSVQTNDLMPLAKKFDVAYCVKKVVEAYQGFAMGKNIQINMSGESRFVTMDEDHFKLIIRNLLHNAIKFTPESGSVDISVREYKDWCEIQIKDTGIGMSESMIGEVLENRIILSSTGTSGEKGTGLGLNVCVELIKANNCKMEISSKIDAGTCFTLKIPN